MNEAVADQSSTVVARMVTDQRQARRILDALSEAFESPEAVLGAFESDNGRWTVTIHFHAPPNKTAVRALVGLAAGPELANALIFEGIGVRDWVKASLDGLPPVEAGRFIVHGSHDRARMRANRIGIEIEAALAFGTGHHGTTRGCLLALDDLIKRRKPCTTRILDVGTGSGVLAIAAARALHAQVLASDIDPRAVAIAKSNARLNRAAAEFIHAKGVATGPFRRRGPFDIVLANILLDPLRRMASPLSRLIAPAGRIVLSGLLTAQSNAAIAAYRAQGLALDRRILLDGWATLVLKRGARAPRMRS
jgi:ribosomal protein L11 methyltransferase